MMLKQLTPWMSCVTTAFRMSVVAFSAEMWKVVIDFCATRQATQHLHVCDWNELHTLETHSSQLSVRILACKFGCKLSLLIT